MKRSAITWLASMHSNFYISPWGQMWKRHRVELRGIAIIGTSGFILSTPQKKGVEGKQLEYSSLDLCKRKENALLCPLTSILQWRHGSCYLLCFLPPWPTASPSLFQKQQRDFVFLFPWIMAFWEIGPFQLSIYCYSIRGPNISFFCLSLLRKINSSKDEQNNSYNKSYRWNNTWSARGKNSKGQIRCWVRAIQFLLLAPLNCAQ